MVDKSSADNILGGIETAWKLLGKLVPAVGANPLASVLYALFTFGVKTSSQLYEEWKDRILSTPITVPLINVPPDPETVSKYLSGNADYKKAFKEELADFGNNEIFLDDAYIALHHFDESQALKEAFGHLIESKNYRAFVYVYEQLSLSDGPEQRMYSKLHDALNAINTDKQSKEVLDNLFKTVTDNINGQLIADNTFWTNLEKVLGDKK